MRNADGKSEAHTPSRRWRKLGLAVGLFVAVILFSTLLVAWDGHSTPLRSYRSAVSQPQLRSIRVLYSWIDEIAYQSGDDETVIGHLQGCGSGNCVPRGAAVISGCAEARPTTCFPPWTRAPDMPQDLLNPPVNGYPSKYAAMASKLLGASSTRCTSRTENPSGHYTIQTICIGADGTVIYRRYGPTY